MKLKHETDMTVAEVCQFFVRQTRHVDSVYMYRTSIGPVERSYNLQQGCLAGSAWSYNTDHLTFSYGEVYAFEHLQFAKTLGDVVDSYHFFRNFFVRCLLIQRRIAS